MYRNLIFILLISCSNNNEITLENEYSITPGITNSDIFILQNGKYERQLNSDAQNTIDLISALDLQEQFTDVYNQTFNRLIIESSDKGRIVRLPEQLEYPIRHSIIDDNKLEVINDYLFD